MIRVENISLDYAVDVARKRRVLRDVSLTIREGEKIALMGPNGSGKSTLARCLNGLLLPAEGTVKVDDLCTASEADLIEIRRRVGMVFQNPDNQIVSATVEREIAFGLENLGLPHDDMHNIVEEMLQQFDLTKYRFKSPHYLSGGEKQKLALAAVLAMKPRYLILDEPTSLLDPRSRKEILQIIIGLNQNLNGTGRVTTMLITQFPEEALHADRLVVMNHGEIVMDDRPEEIFSRIEKLDELGLEIPVKFRLEKLLQEHLNPLGR